MKTHFSRRTRNLIGLRHKPHRPGFALVITLTLMILLTVVGVGLLTLSSISLRSSSQGEAMQQARSNARMALALAIGQLQKGAGPDQRITAPANLSTREAHPGLTGVWESLKLSPDGNPELDTAKRSERTTEMANGEFLGWLSSQSWGNSSGAPSSPPSSGNEGSVATLLKPLAPDSITPPLTQNILPITETGGIAWATIDEGVKARFDLPTDSAKPTGEQQKARLRAPSRTSPEVNAGLASLKLDEAAAGKMASFRQGELVSGAKNAFLALDEALTPWSMSLPVNVADGGLKADLTQAFEKATLPSELTGRYLYSNLKTPLTVADPLFSNLAAYYRLYDSTNGGTTALTTSIPAGYRPTKYDARARSNVPNLAALDGNLIAPVVSRVQVAFSLVSREAHGNWATSIPNTTKDPRRNYMVYLIYTPVVTLYNPYNAPINVNNLKATFKYLPLAFQFYRNGAPQTNQPGLLSQYHISSENRTDWEDQFTTTLSNSPGSSSSSLLIMPGEAKVFGVNHPAGTKWGNMTNYLWQNDLASSKTLNLYTGSGWNYRTGFIVDWLRPAIAGRTADNSSLGVFGARGDDRINVACVPKMPGGSNGQFSVDISARIGNRDTQIGSYRYRYGTEKRLVEALESGAPPSVGMVTYPFKREKDWNLNELYQPAVETTPVESWTGPKQFAIFTLADRTAQDSLYPSKPVAQSSFVHQVMDMDITTIHPAQMPMELSFLPIRNEGANTVGSIEADALDRSYFFSGNRLATGMLNYPSIQVPAAPLVNIGSFRHAHLASSGHLPSPTFTVGESRAQPLLPSDKALLTTSTFGYALSDHSWLSNNSLWDGYYLSALRNTAEARTFFSESISPLNPRLAPQLSAGTSADSAAERATSETAWTSNASRQWIKGGFNVNSTSVAAWKTVLASLADAEIPVLDPVTAQESLSQSSGYPMPRMIRGLSGEILSPVAASNQNRWTGFRTLNQNQIEALADKIVGQVRLRGPFLSMSEFVNRRLGSSTDITSTGGALDIAIRESGINAGANGANLRLVTEADATKFAYANSAAAVGDTEEGSNAFLSQGDVLEALGASLTVRSDTFVIRAYGDAKDASGKIIARAVCEAVVQRISDFVDSTDAADKVQAALGDPARSIDALSEPNRRFGRRFEILNLRWISSEEV